ncbi:MAG: hypothetical protein HXX11_06240 [Desulfuromonadales bacterium]|nr:hypothetical protein [Desulfuromonadales bacterium]
MKHARFATLVLLLFIHFLPLPAAAFPVHSPGDLTGNWEVNGLESPGPWWSRGPITIADNGTFSGTSNGPDNSATPISGTFTIAEDGIITATSSVLTSSFRCAMENGSRFAACTGTTTENESELTLLVKKSAGYAQSDLAGAWNVNSIVSGPGAPWWSRGAVTIGPTGSFTGTLTYSDDDPEDVSGTFTLGSDGVIVSPLVDPDFRAVLDSGKSVVVGTSTWDSGAPNSTELSVWTKKAASYSLADLAGAWQVNELGAPGPSWTRGVMTVAANGTFSGTFDKSNGNTESRSGTFSITSDGVITVLSPNLPASTRCTMDEGKNVVVCTYINSNNNAKLAILTSYRWILSVTMGGTGSGTVVDMNGGNFWSATEAAAYAHGTQVMLMATVYPNSLFGGWSGACTGTVPNCTVTMDASKNVTAYFYAIAPTLPVITTFTLPPTSSSVTVPVTLVAESSTGIAGYYLSENGTTPTAGSTGWSGTLPATFTFSGKGTGILHAWVKDIANNISLRSSASVNIQCLLTVTKSGSGAGDINCNSGSLIWSGSTGRAAYDVGTVVLLSEVPDSLSTFSNWSGDCTPSGLNCTASMADDRNVNAVFTLAPKAMIGLNGYPSLNAAYSAATTPGATTILTLDAELLESLDMRSGAEIVLMGGYNTTYNGRTGIPTRLKGLLTVGSGKLTVDGLAIK